MPRTKQKVTYKKNFLTNVILRFDFDKVNLASLTEFSKEIEVHFPLQEQQEEKGVSFIIDTKTQRLEQAPETTICWQYFTPARDKKLKLTNSYVLIEYTKYKNFEEVFIDFENVLLKFLNRFGVETVNRTGLRYTNRIDLEEIKDNFEWKTYLNKELLGSYMFALKKKERIARSMGQIYFKKEDADITFNFGIWNNDFPNENTRKDFILDYDAHSRFPFGVTKDLKNVIKNYNNYIEKLFESSIEEPLRNLLNKN